MFPGLHPGLFHAGLLDAARQAGARVIGYTPALRMITDRPARASENRRSLRCGISIRSIAQRERRLLQIARSEILGKHRIILSDIVAFSRNTPSRRKARPPFEPRIVSSDEGLRMKE